MLCGEKLRGSGIMVREHASRFKGKTGFPPAKLAERALLWNQSSNDAFHRGCCHKLLPVTFVLVNEMNQTLRDAEEVSDVADGVLIE